MNKKMNETISLTLQMISIILLTIVIILMLGIPEGILNYRYS